MRDFTAFKRSAVRYWERRRIFYNLALVPPSFFGFALADTLNYVGDPHRLNYWRLLLLFGLSGLGANICYSFAFALEFVLGSDDPTSRWLRFGRAAMFVAGILFGMLLAFLGGVNIAHFEFYFRAQASGLD